MLGRLARGFALSEFVNSNPRILFDLGPANFQEIADGGRVTGQHHERDQPLDRLPSMNRAVAFGLPTPIVGLPILLSIGLSLRSDQDDLDRFRQDGGQCRPFPVMMH
jgi:hypothetical protein